MYQCQRPQWEQDLPAYVRDDLDRRRMASDQNANENPALYSMLCRIDAKLDRILKLLETE